MRLTSVEKDWEHVLMEKVVTLYTCCDVACLTFQLHTSQPVLFGAANAIPQPAVFGAINIGGFFAPSRGDMLHRWEEIWRG